MRASVSSHELLRPFAAALIVGVLVATSLTARSQTPSAPRRFVDPLSLTSLLIRLLSGNVAIGTATGFIVQKGSSYYLVTNWHVVTDKNPDTGASLDSLQRTPDRLQILQNAKGRLGEWHWVTEELFDATHAPRWKEHSATNKRVDVVLLPLASVADVDFYPLDLKLRDTPIKVSPAAQISVVGFPYGEASFEGLPIWKSGSVASDPDIDYGNSPQFLIDATGRPGMSGSPVYAIRTSGYQEEDGDIMMAPGRKFLGVYAGDIDQTSEVGRVWKASALMEIYDRLP